MGAIHDVTQALAAAAAEGKTPRRVHVSPRVYQQLLAEYPGGHPELPVEPIRQLSTDYGVVEIVVDDRADIQVAVGDRSVP
jgi:hypothetical protein